MGGPGVRSHTQVRIATQLVAAALPLKKTLNHRTRVGADRREKMRMRLIESAMLVFARSGADGSVIDEVIRIAEVSRGTFYNYFRTNEDLLIAVAGEVANQLLQIVDPVVRGEDDPAARVAYGVRLTLKVAQAHPHLAAFLARVGPPALNHQSLVTEVLPRDLATGMASGRFFEMHPRLAFDLVTGPVLAGLHSLVTTGVPASYAEDMAQAVLMALGVPRAAARKLANLPVAAIALAPDSLLVRAQARAAQRANA